MPCRQSKRTNTASPSRGRLYRDSANGWFAGVCAGIADYLGLNRGLVRLIIFILAFPFTLSVLAAYLIMACILHRKPDALYQDPAEEQFWRQVRVEPSRSSSDLVNKFERIERKLRQAEARVTSSSFRLRRAFKDLENGERPIGG